LNSFKPSIVQFIYLYRCKVNKAIALFYLTRCNYFVQGCTAACFWVRLTYGFLTLKFTGRLAARLRRSRIAFPPAGLRLPLKLNGWLAASASPQPHFFPSAGLRLPLKFTEPAGFQPASGLLEYSSIRIK
jgi:hypothetical protein